MSISPGRHWLGIHPCIAVKVVVICLAALSTASCGVLCHLNNSCACKADSATQPSNTCESRDVSGNNRGNGSSVSQVRAGERILAITPVFQETLVWCWLASAQMIFTHYRVPPVNGISYQCGIMGAVTGPNSICFFNCGLCQFGSGSDFASAQVLRQYPAIVQQVFLPQVRVPQINATLFERRLSPTEVQTEIDAGHPVELGITPQGPFQGQAAHDVVLIGYSAPNSTTLYLIINDPAPYELIASPSQNPYRVAGGTVVQPYQYKILYDSAASRLQWSASITTSPF